jgi:hypothetical protein
LILLPKFVRGGVPIGAHWDPSAERFREEYQCDRPVYLGSLFDAGSQAAAAQRAVLRDPGLNQVPLHARQQALAVVQRQAKRIEDRMRVAAATSGNFVGLLRSIGAAQFDRHPPLHSRPPVFHAPTLAPPCLGRSPRKSPYKFRPVCPVVWEGRHHEVPPIPINQGFGMPARVTRWLIAASVRNPSGLVTFRFQIGMRQNRTVQGRGWPKEPRAAFLPGAAYPHSIVWNIGDQPT